MCAPSAANTPTQKELAIGVTPAKEESPVVCTDSAPRSHVKRVCLWSVQCNESGESIFSCVSHNKRRSKYLTSGSTKCGERASTLQLPCSNGKADRNKTDERNQRTLDCGSSGGRVDQAHVTHHSRTAAYTRHKKRRPERDGFSTQRDNAARASLTCSLSAELEHRAGPRLLLPLQPTPLRGRICPHLEATGSKRQYELEKDEKVAAKAYMSPEVRCSTSRTTRHLYAGLTAALDKRRAAEMARKCRTGGGEQSEDDAREGRQVCSQTKQDLIGKGKAGVKMGANDGAST